MRRRWLLVAGVGVVLLIQATGGFSAATLDRPFSVSVVDGSDGLLGVEAHDQDALDNGNNKDIGLLSLENQFGDVALDQVDVDVTGDTEGPPPVITDVSTPGTLAASGSGSKGVVAADITCGSNENGNGTANGNGNGTANGNGNGNGNANGNGNGNGNDGSAGNSETFAVDIAVSGDGVSVELTEEVTVTCTGDPPAHGNGGTTTSSA